MAIRFHRSADSDKRKTLAQLKEQDEKDLRCQLDGCDEPLSMFTGPGSNRLCRRHQLEQTCYGGLGRVDRPHTFHRKWECDNCKFNPLEHPMVLAIENEALRYRAARSLMHGDHQIRKSDGGSDAEDNILCLCIVCHHIKTILNEDYLPGIRTET